MSRLVLLALVGVVATVAQDSLPSVSLKLAPPSRSEVQAQLARLAKTRGSTQAEQMAALDKAYESALASAQAGIAKVTAKLLRARSAAFLSKSASKELAITLEPPVESDVVGSLDAIMSSEISKSEEAMADYASMKSAMLDKAKAEIASIIGARSKSVAFLSRAPVGDEFTVKVNLLPAPAASATVQKKIEAVDSKLRRGEEKLFAQALQEMNSLSAIVQSELQHQIRSQLQGRESAAFLQTALRDLPKVANVVVGASAPFETTADMVEAMETDQFASMAAVLRRVLTLEQKLLEEQNAMIQQALASALA